MVDGYIPEGRVLDFLREEKEDEEDEDGGAWKPCARRMIAGGLQHAYQ